MAFQTNNPEDRPYCPYRRSGGRGFWSLALLLLVATLATTGCRNSAFYEGSNRRTTGEITDDLQIQSRVKSRLIRHRQVRGWRTDVDVFKGVVQLTGYVRSATERQAAGDVARTTRGVAAVDNKLVIK